MNQPAGWVSSLSDFRGAESSLILNSLGNQAMKRVIEDLTNDTDFVRVGEMIVTK
mgnify:CR=1 FL=1